jgi:hypothetical protein
MIPPAAATRVPEHAQTDARLIGDTGNLAKLVMADAGTRDIPNPKTMSPYQMNDCLATYSHVMPGDRRQAAARFAELVAGAEHDHDPSGASYQHPFRGWFTRPARP